jgi:hypothetical protein
MTGRILTFFFSAFFLTITLFAGVIKDGTLSAESDGANITVRWMSEDETAVSRFVLERKAGINGSFMPLVELQPTGNNSSYQFVDETAFRLTQSIYQYRLRVLFSNGTPPWVSGSVTVSHRTSEVRRTWGSIKAMFR